MIIEKFRVIYDKTTKKKSLDILYRYVPKSKHRRPQIYDCPSVIIAISEKDRDDSLELMDNYLKKNKIETETETEINKSEIETKPDQTNETMSDRS